MNSSFPESSPRSHPEFHQETLPPPTPASRQGDTGQRPSPRQRTRKLRKRWSAVALWTRDNTFTATWLPKPLRHPLVGYNAAVLIEGTAVAGVLLLQEKQYADAHQAASAALEAAEQLANVTLQTSAWLIVAQVQEEERHLKEATTSYEHAIELLHSQESPDATAQLREVYTQFSEYLERHGESERAFEMLKQAYKSTQHT
jgi:tetratricopeptide (TPR) repeat protein